MNTRQVLNLLRHYESRNITFLDPDATWPIVWERAQGASVWDAEGRRYLDQTAAFGVAAAGHANTRVVSAGQRQLAVLPHAMGDVHPHALKAQLARELSRLTFERWHRRRTGTSKRGGARGKAIFCNSGFEAVEAALKTARRATGRPGILAFEGGYHGLGYGTLNTTHRKHFRAPFLDQLRQFGHFLPFPAAPPQPRVTLKALRYAATALFRRNSIGAILVEPVQARGGINVPPTGFLRTLRKLCDEHEALLIVDEIYTGFGRTGTWFACEQSSVRPDLICLGKALTGGFPMSACIGEATLMDAAWPESTGEAIHTSTFLGHPVGCAMALAQIAELKRLRLISRSARLGRMLLQELTRVASDFPPSRNRARPGSFQCFARGLGLMAGLELQHADGSPAGAETIEIVKRMLQRGILLLPEGEHGNVIGFTPPLILTEQQIQRTTRILKQTMVEVLGPNRTRPAGRKGRTASRRRSGRRAPAPESIPKQPQKPPALLRTRR